METLVAVIVVALTVTVFFQLLSGSMNLEARGRDLTRETLLADRLFQDLQRLDIREPDFPWRGESHGLAWELRIQPVDVEDTQVDIEDLLLKLPRELYRYVFDYSRDGHPRGTITRYETYPRDFFDDQFRAAHLSSSQ